MLAIFKVQGKQYMVTKGDVIEVSRIKDAQKGKTLTFGEVLLFVSRGIQKIGQPYIHGAKVKVRVLESTKKGRKIEVLKFKPKKRYTKKMGFRPLFTVLKIQDIVCK